MKLILLTKGLFTKVDDEDFDTLNKFKWQATNHNNNKTLYIKHYASRKVYINKKYVVIYMHRLLMKTPAGMLTDHIDNDSLNNQKCNLRICSKGENQRNSNRPITNTSGYKGVYFHQNKYMAAISLNNRFKYIGIFDTPLDAALAYDNKAREIYGEFARPNFKAKMQLC
jgi:hypothetical protein